jgi:hypothetical protein
MTVNFQFVTPFNDAVIHSLAGQRMMIEISNPQEVRAIGQMLARQQCNLDAVILETSESVTSLPFDESWKTVPLLIRAPELGRVSRLLHHIPVIRGMSLRIMLPTNLDMNYISLRILSSMGIPSGFLLDGRSADWEQLLDLATYYYFSLMSPAPISPFDTLGERYVPGEGAPFGSALLDEPTISYLYVNKVGQIAMSREDLENGKILCHSIDGLAESEVMARLEDEVNVPSRFFMASGACSTCPGWKLCRGRVAEDDGSVPDGCSSFFIELMDTIEEYQAMKAGVAS